MVKDGFVTDRVVLGGFLRGKRTAVGADQQAVGGEGVQVSAGSDVANIELTDDIGDSDATGVAHHFENSAPTLLHEQARPVCHS